MWERHLREPGDDLPVRYCETLERQSIDNVCVEFVVVFSLTAISTDCREKFWRNRLGTCDSGIQF